MATLKEIQQIPTCPDSIAKEDWDEVRKNWSINPKKFLIDTPIGEQTVIGEEYREPQYWDLPSPTSKNLIAYACFFAPKTVDYLLNKGYDPNGSYHYRHPIEICIDECNEVPLNQKMTEEQKNLYFQIAKSILEKGCSYKVLDIFKRVYKDQICDPRWMKLAVEKGLDLKKAIPKQELPTVPAFSVYYYEKGPYLNDAVEFFLDQGFEPNNKKDIKLYNLQYLTRNPLPEPLLTRALSSFSKEDLNQTFEGDTPNQPETVLSKAISKGLVPIVKILLDKGADPNGNHPNNNPLLRCIHTYNSPKATSKMKEDLEEITELLLKKGAFGRPILFGSTKEIPLSLKNIIEKHVFSGSMPSTDNQGTKVYL